jgi:hypothetical protein
MRLRIPSRRAVAFAVASVVVCYLAFWACAPTMTLPPPVPFAEDERGEFSVGAVVAGPGTNMDVGPELQLGYVWHLRAGVALGMQAYGGVNTFAGGGAVFRWLATPTERFAVGLQGQVGWLHGSIAIPMSWSLGERAWIWASPATAASYTGLLSMPLGVTLAVGESGLLSFEAGVRLLGVQDEYLLGADFGPQYYHVGVAWSRRGKRRR